MPILVNLENRQTRIKLMFAYLKHSLLVGVRRCLDCLGLSLHPFKNFELVSNVTLKKIAQRRRLSYIFDKHQPIWFHHARIQ